MGSILKGFGLHNSKRRGHRPTLFDRHPGQAIVLIAFLMIVLIGFTGLAVDGGELYFLQKNVQNAADAAVMAGLYEICSDPSRTLIDAHDAAVQNAEQALNDNGFYDGVDGTTIAFTHPGDPDGAGPEGVTSHYFVVDITARKPARLIQLVYQGPLQVTVRAAGICKPVEEWTEGAAMFGIGACEAPDMAISFSGSNIHVEGGVFGNGDLDINPGGPAGSNTIEGGVTSAGDPDDHNKITYTNPSSGQPSANQPQRTPPQFWEVDDFKPDGKTAEWAASLTPNAYFSATGNVNSWDDFSPNPLDANGDPKDGIYYAAGEIDLGDPAGETGSSMDLNGLTFVAGTKIILDTNQINYMVAYTVPEAEVIAAGYNVLPLAFTEYPQPNSEPTCEATPSTTAIDIGTKFSFLGAIYAPFGFCKFSGASANGEGGIMCYTMDLSGSEFSMIYNPEVFPPPPPSVGMDNP